MVKFYVTQLKTKSTEERQAYLDETVPSRFRDQVRKAWNEQHPDEELK